MRPFVWGLVVKFAKTLLHKISYQWHVKISTFWLANNIAHIALSIINIRFVNYKLQLSVTNNIYLTIALFDYHDWFVQLKASI